MSKFAKGKHRWVKGCERLGLAHAAPACTPFVKASLRENLKSSFILRYQMSLVLQRTIVRRATSRSASRIGARRRKRSRQLKKFARCARLQACCERMRSRSTYLILVCLVLSGKTFLRDHITYTYTRAWPLLCRAHRPRRSNLRL